MIQFQLDIKMAVLQQTNEIVLNSKDLSFTDDSFSITKKVKVNDMKVMNGKEKG